MGKNSAFYWILFFILVTATGLLAFGDQNDSDVKECSYCHESINIEDSDYVVSSDDQYWHTDCYLKEEH